MGDTSGPIATADWLSDRLYGAVGWLLIGLGLLAAATAALDVIADPTVTTLFFAGALLAVSAVSIALGLFVNPGLRRRLGRRHALSTFGTVRAVDTDVFRMEDGFEECTACLCRTEEGIVRRSREEFVIAGIPLYTASETNNHYCPECGAAELSVPDRSNHEPEAAKRDTDAGESERAFERNRRGS